MTIMLKWYIPLGLIVILMVLTPGETAPSNRVLNSRSRGRDFGQVSTLNDVLNLFYHPR